MKPPGRMNRIAIAYNTMFYIYNFRLPLIRELQARGYLILAAAPFDGYEKRLRAEGVRCLNLSFRSNSINPLLELRLILRFRRLFRREKPQCLLCFTIKPNIYGSLAARLAGVPVVNNITGLGSAFIQNGPLTVVVRALYRLALATSRCVFFQNDDDQDLFLKRGIVRRTQCRRIPGSGIDLERFRPAAPARTGTFVFLLVGRLIRDKGVHEYVAAADRLGRKPPGAEFRLLGELDADNPGAVSAAAMEDWVKAGTVRYLGVTDDVRPFIAAADCVVLPSYREGLSRTLLEAAAMAKPLIASDVPGCREVVEDGRTGFLCRARDAGDLARKMELMMDLSPAERAAMGRRGRAKIEREYDEKIVIRAYLDAVDEIIQKKRARRDTA